jgi:hypothetical protein
VLSIRGFGQAVKTCSVVFRRMSFTKPWPKGKGTHLHPALHTLQNYTLVTILGREDALQPHSLRVTHAECRKLVYSWLRTEGHAGNATILRVSINEI